ncbi:MAG: threonine/serine dehydratase [Candidatus Aminicenantales bacterium]
MQDLTPLAEKRIKDYIRVTPLEYSPYLSQRGKCNVYLKLENFQLTGSFKLRGAMNKLLSLTPVQRKRGVITASTGNHGLAVAHGVSVLGGRGIIYLPHNATSSKIERLRTYNVELRFQGHDCLQAELSAKKYAEEHGMDYISPYNDLKIIAGQATVGKEISEQAEKIDCVLVPVGGGGLISGVAGYLKQKEKEIEVIGCQPEASPVMYESLKAGKIIDMESKETLSDGTAGGIEKEAITFELCRKYVDDFYLVSEEEIKEALKFLIEKHFFLVEGAGALTLAAFLQRKEHFKGKNVVLIISGSGISLNLLKKILG